MYKFYYTITQEQDRMVINSANFFACVIFEEIIFPSTLCFLDGRGR